MEMCLIFLPVSKICHKQKKSLIKLIKCTSTTTAEVQFKMAATVNQPQPVVGCN